MDDILELEHRYTKLYTKFVFIFAHDTKQDALAFVKEYKIESAAVLANHYILKTFHNPTPPTIYIGDRHGWMTARYIKLEQAQIPEVDKILGYFAVR